ARDRRGVEPGEVEAEARRGEHRIGHAQLPAVEGGERAESGDQQMVDAVDDALGARRKTVGDDAQREMHALDDGDRGADGGEPGEAELAHLLDPEEADGVEIEIIGDLHHHVAQQHAREQVEHHEHEQQREEDFRNRRDDVEGMRGHTYSIVVRARETNSTSSPGTSSRGRALLRATVSKDGSKLGACFHPSRRPLAAASGLLRMTVVFVACEITKEKITPGWPRVPTWRRTAS